MKWLGGKLSDALEALLSEHAGQLRKLGAMLAAGWLAKRLPGPLGALSRWLVSGLSGDRGFGFWWMVVTLGIALAVGALLAVLVSPVAAVIALLVVGIWMLVRRTRKEDGDEDHANDGGERRTPASDDASGDSEREPAAVPSPAQ